MSAYAPLLALWMAASPAASPPPVCADLSPAACAAALVERARVLGRQGQMAAARGALEEAVRTDGKNPEAHFQLGVWFFRARIPTQARQAFQHVLALRPQDARAHDYLALCLESLGDAAGAEAAFRGALAANQEGPYFDPLLDYNYGKFLLKQNRLEESATHLDRAVARLPGRRGPHYERGKLNLARKDYTAARRDAERALGIPDPGGLVLDLQVYYLLATVYSRLGETELARKYAELARTTPIPDQARDR